MENLKEREGSEHSLYSFGNGYFPARRRRSERSGKTLSEDSEPVVELVAARAPGWGDLNRPITDQRSRMRYSRGGVGVGWLVPVRERATSAWLATWRRALFSGPWLVSLARGHWRQRQPASMFSLSRSVTCPRVETPAPAGREPGTRMFLDHADPKLQSCRRRDHAKIHFSEVGFTSQIFHRASLGKPFLLWIEGDRLIEGKTSSPSSLQSTNTN